MAAEGVPTSYRAAHDILDEVDCELQHYGRKQGRECNMIDLSYRAFHMTNIDRSTQTYEEALGEVIERYIGKLCAKCPARQWLEKIQED